MRNINFYKLFYNIFYYFCRICKSKTITWLIPELEMQRDRSQAAVSISGFTQSLYRPVARNGIKQCSRWKAGAGNKK
jgi:hypothetical protein